MMRDKQEGGKEMKNMVRSNSRLMGRKKSKHDQKGSAMVLALLVMILLMGFVALAISRTNSETVAAANDAAESRTFEAAHASLEVMTRNFSKVFDLKMNPDSADLSRIESQAPPGFDDYSFLPNQKIVQTRATEPVVMTGELFQGLNALRDEWKLDTIATSKKDGVEVALSRRFFNNRIPIFQFGIFYDDDLEFHPGPRFDFGGRVHSNGNIFLAASTGLYFASKVSAKGEIITDVQKNGFSYTSWDDNVFVKNASGTFIQLQYNMGSALKSPVNGTPLTNTPLPKTYRNATWPTQQAKFQGNLLADQKPLDLPVKLNSQIANPDNPLDYIELVKRGRNVGDMWNDGTGTAAAPSVVAVTAAKADDEITEHERYYGKNGMRIALADSKAKLPGCATATGAAVTTPCGVRLDGVADGQGGNPIAPATDRGYQPRAMSGTPAYQATRLNGNRFWLNIPTREMWIKIETNGYDQPTNTYVTADITEDILALGVTEPAPQLGTNFALAEPSNYYTGNVDKRSIVKLQRFMIDGADITTQTSNTDYISKNTNTWADVAPYKAPYNFVMPAYFSGTTANCALTSSPTGVDDMVNPNTGAAYTDERAHWKKATMNLSTPSGTNNVKCIAPFPINMFDTREGLYYEGTSTFNPTAAANYGKNVPWAGVMSMVDIDIANLRAFLAGDFNTNMPTGTPWATANGRAIKSTDIRNSNGWVVYVSDRRGDFDFDGEYDMEDVYGNNDGITQPGEDINHDGILQADYASGEAVKYRGSGSNISPDVAAVFEHKYFRRGVRLVNGTKIPGKYDTVNPKNTVGFTFASENAVYVKGNYNATGVASYGTPTPPADYLPQNTVDHIPASIAGDAIVILSNSWSDARSFVYPFSLADRRASETTLRFAALTGDTITSLDGEPDQGGGNPRMSGGVHNFKRFLEDWDNSINLNYSGSLINMFNSRGNNGTFKCCAIIYAPPERNWVFDTTFLDGNRLPPGTPFFQVIQLTGFQRLN